MSEVGRDHCWALQNKHGEYFSEMEPDKEYTSDPTKAIMFKTRRFARLAADDGDRPVKVYRFFYVLGRLVG